ncbi:MAG: exodeoxyribonuclease V subunit alpha [Persicimonas sp.]
MQQDLFTTNEPPKKAEALSPKSRRRLSGFEARLVDRAADHDLSAAMVHYASELVRLQTGLELHEERALLLLVLASIVEQRNGSTRLPLELGEGGYLRGLVGELLRGHEDEAARVCGHIAGLLERFLADEDASAVIGGPGAYRPLIVDGPYLYQQRMLHCEDRLVESISRRLALEDAQLSEDTVKEALDGVLWSMPTLADGTQMKLNAEQQYALLSAAHRPLSIISGGPGTGKTSIVVSLLRMLARLGVDADDIALAAPTGKAANRLGESIEAQLAALAEPAAADGDLGRDLSEPRTLHRLLGYSPAYNGFYYHENNRLRQRVVIVDEASMIDLFLMERLVAAVDPGARLVLLGDAEQLPSVDAGAVFRDLVPRRVDTRASWRALAQTPLEEDAELSDEPTAANAVRLEKSYRMDPTSPSGSSILRCARRINRGEYTPLFDTDRPLISVREATEDIVREGVELLEPAADRPQPDPQTLGAFVEWWYTHQVAGLDEFRRQIVEPFSFDGERFDEAATARLERLFEHFSSFRVLTITRVFITGAERLNAAFHARHRRLLGPAHAESLEVGEPIIMLQNDYSRGLFNGDQGLVVDVVRPASAGRRTQRMAVFERNGRFVPFNLEPLRRHIEHAFALTVHKAQGSEFDGVAIVLPAEALPLYTREILYTGITRSRRSVVMVGRRELIEAASQNPVRRFSGIAEKLAGGEDGQ